MKDPAIPLGMESLLRKITRRGYQLMVPTLDSDYCTFFLNKISTRQISIREVPEGYEVKIPTLASRRDFILFRNILETMNEEVQPAEILQEEKTIDCIEKYFSDNWIRKMMTNDYNIQTIFALNGDETRLNCPIRPFYMGKRIMRKLGITEDTPIEIGRKALIERIRYTQYAFPFGTKTAPVVTESLFADNKDKSFTVTYYSQNCCTGITRANFFAISRPRKDDPQKNEWLILQYDNFIRCAPPQWELFDNCQFFTTDLTDEEFAEFWERCSKFHIKNAIKED